jgi:hypothetical protein
MPHFVRCIDGHVFDAEVALKCPVCGAIVDAPPLAPAAAPPPITPPVSDSDGAQTKPPALPAWRELPAQLRRSALRIVIGGVLLAPILAMFKLFVLPSIYPPAGQFPSAPSPPAQAAVNAPNAAAPWAPPVAKVDVTGTIQAALDVVRVNALYARHDAQQVIGLTQKLAAQGNPAGVFDLGVLAINGVFESQNLPEARKEFTAAANLGYPFAAEAAGRMLENGAGGSKDLDGAKALYLFAARSGNADANKDLARLNMSDQIGMTVSDANSNLIAGKDVDDSWRFMNKMIAAHSTPAICLAGWRTVAGDSTAKDFKHALDLFGAGAITANPSCMWGLSRSLAGGLPYLPRNLIEADVLLRLTAGDNPTATGFATELAELENQMSDGDKAEAQKIIQTGILPSNLSEASR